jgi:hypothetical protein
MSDLADAMFEVIRFDDLAIPVRGPTGSPVKQLDSFEVQYNHETYHYLPRPPPDRDEPVWDDDGVIYYRRLTDEEYAAALEATARFNAEWERTNGTFVKYRGADYEIEVTCADGCKATASGDGYAWRWTRATWPL